MTVQCKHCGLNFAKEGFEDHVKACIEDADRDRASVLLPPNPQNN